MRTFILLSLLASGTALAAEPSNAELMARIAGLEARMAQLEGRLGQASPVAAAATGKALDLDLWRKCKAGQTKEEVMELLGKATTEQFVSAVNQYPDMETWYYGTPGVGPGGSVVFMGGKVVQCITVGFTTNTP